MVTESLPSPGKGLRKERSGGAGSGEAGEDVGEAGLRDGGKERGAGEARAHSLPGAPVLPLPLPTPLPDALSSEQRYRSKLPCREVSASYSLSLPYRTNSESGYSLLFLLHLSENPTPFCERLLLDYKPVPYPGCRVSTAWMMMEGNANEENQ